MITLVSGAIDSGKTTWLAKHFSAVPQGDGFISQKFYHEGQIQGYHAVRLSTKETLPWLIREESSQPFKNESRIGPFRANLDTLHIMEQAYETMMSQNIHPIYLDEIGEWELSGQGFDSIFRKMLTSRCDLIVVVRKELLVKVISHYELKNYEVLWSSK